MASLGRVRRRIRSINRGLSWGVVCPQRFSEPLRFPPAALHSTPSVNVLLQKPFREQQEILTCL